MIDFSATPQGVLLGLGLFACPGPKDVLILREALAGRSPILLVAIGTGSDVVLIALGILGLSAAFHALPVLRTGATLLGAALLAWHALLAARNAWSRPAGSPLAAASTGGLRDVVAVSLFNPAAWLDTVLVIGAVGVTLPAHQRAGYAAGAVAASLAWFAGWVLAARQARRLMNSPRCWRVLDAGIGVAMAGMAGWLLFGPA
jgi:L-lysine exporter family protein LysE/ArgO